MNILHVDGITTAGTTARRHAKTTDRDGRFLADMAGMAEMMKTLVSNGLDGCTTDYDGSTTDKNAVVNAVVTTRAPLADMADMGRHGGGVCDGCSTDRNAVEVPSRGGGYASHRGRETALRVWGI